VIASRRASGRRLVDRLARLSALDVLTAMHVAGLLALVEVLVRMVPLPSASRLLGVRVEATPPLALEDPLDSATLTSGERRRLRWARRLSDRWPFSRGPCLRRALVGGRLLRHRHPVVRLGLAGSGDALVGHAWLEIDGHPLETLSGVTPFRRSGAGAP
jgi:Transglutaminase-like superfamily